MRGCSFCTPSFPFGLSRISNTGGLVILDHWPCLASPLRWVMNEVGINCKRPILAACDNYHYKNNNRSIDAYIFLQQLSRLFTTRAVSRVMSCVSMQ